MCIRDSAAASALLSSLTNTALAPDRVFFGEISLSGAIRQTGHMATRLKEAQKLGFKSAVVPAAGDVDTDAFKMKLYRSGHLQNIATALMKKSQ